MTQEKVKELFWYEDGQLYNRGPRAGGKVKAGSLVGCINNTGYLRTESEGKKYLVHRLIFLYHKGFMPAEIDHEDGNPLNNKINNLRAATHFQNMANVKKPITNTSGLKGVCWHKREQKWRAQINVNNKKMYLGSFASREQAHEAYKAAALHHFKEFANV